MAFDDIYGYEDVKEKLLKLKGYYDRKEEYDKQGIDLPKGLMLYGEPGCGKSLFASEFASFLDPSPAVITSKFDIISAFGKAGMKAEEEQKPKVVLIDEIDLMLAKDPDTTRKLQTCIDGFSSKNNVFVIATTNSYHSIPAALLRKGRFDYQIEISSPKKKERITLIKQFFDKYKISTDEIDFDYLGTITEGFNCADIKNLVNNIRLSLFNNITKRGIEDIVGECTDNSYSIAPKDERNYGVAIHEAGHAFLTLINDQYIHFFRSALCSSSTVKGITICDKNDESECMEKVLASIQISLAGRLAEEEVINFHGLGSSSDYRQARNLAEQLVTSEGYGNGVINIAPIDLLQRTPSFIKKHHFERKYEKILIKQERKTRKIIRHHKAVIRKIADIIMENGLITREEALKLI